MKCDNICSICGKSDKFIIFECSSALQTTICYVIIIIIMFLYSKEIEMVETNEIEKLKVIFLLTTSLLQSPIYRSGSCRSTSDILQTNIKLILKG